MRCVTGLIQNFDAVNLTGEQPDVERQPFLLQR